MEDDCLQLQRWISDAARLDLEDERDQLTVILGKANASPKNTAIFSGGFVDARRMRNDVAYFLSRANSGAEI